jgi:hypothetical protein
MTLDPLLGWLESTALSQWVIGSPSLFAFPGILALHAIGMGFAVGVSVAIDLRALGAVTGIPLSGLRRFVPVFWFGFWLNAVSGLLLLIGYPTKALTNPVFYLKLLLIGVAVAALVRMARLAAHEDERDGRALKRLALVSLACWTGAIAAGRLLAYTYTRLTVYQ